MSNSSEILQYHIDKKLKRLNPKMLIKLSPKQKAELQMQLDLHHKLSGMRVRKPRGYASLEAALQGISLQNDYDSKPLLLRYKLQFISFGALMLVLVGIMSGSKVFNSSQPSDSNSQITADFNTTLNNLNSLNISDAQNDVATSAVDDAAISTAKAELSSTTNLDGEFNENF